MFPRVGNIQWQPMIAKGHDLESLCCQRATSCDSDSVLVHIALVVPVNRGKAAESLLVTSAWLVTGSLPAEARRKSLRVSYAKP